MRKQVRHPQKLSDCFGGGASTMEKTCIPSKPKKCHKTYHVLPHLWRSVDCQMHRTNWHKVGWQHEHQRQRHCGLRRLQQRIVCDAEVLDVLLHKLFCPHQLFIGRQMISKSHNCQELQPSSVEIDDVRDPQCFNMGGHESVLIRKQASLNIGHHLPHA